VGEGLAIETADLWKSYGGTEVLRGLHLAVPAGSIFGLLGPNGAGKTTTLKVLLGMTRPSAGRVRVLGMPADDPAASVDIRRRVAFVSEDKAVNPNMTVSEIIRFTATFYPRWSRDLEAGYLRRFAIPPGQAVRALSPGTRTKLALLLALCRGTELLLLDEPTSGLDPSSTEDVLQTLVSDVTSNGRTIFFSSHQLADVEQIADHVAIVEHGRVAVAGPLDDLRAAYCRVQAVFGGAAPSVVYAAPGVVRVETSGRVVTIWSSAGPDRVSADVRARGAVSVDVFPVTLKELFLETVRGEH
jgi:ABC-2 type transport system ATP-binding protein